MKVFLRTTIDRADREEIIVRHYDGGPSGPPDPTAIEDERMVGFTLYLYNPHWTCSDTGWPVISRDICATIDGELDELESKHYVAKDFLEEYRERVDPTFEWAGYDMNSTARRARVFAHDEDLLTSILSKGPEDMIKRIYTIDGTVFNRKKQRAARERMYEEAMATRDHALCRVQQDVLDYMNGLPADRFTRAYKKYGPAAYAEADRLYRTGAINENAYSAALSALRATGDQPKPHYGCSTRMRSTRIFPAHAGMLTLKSEVSEVLRKDWTTLDLVWSQTAINARAWGAEETLAFLEANLHDDGALWRRWFTHLGFDFDRLKAEAKAGDAIEYNRVKKPLKIGNYATQFGMCVPGVLATLDKAVGEGTGERMLEDELFDELLHCREDAFRDIEANGATDCFGNYLQVEPGQDACSVSAQLAQAQELQLLYPAIEYVKATDRADIVLWQHDGFDLQCRRRTDKHVAEIQALVDAKARVLGIPTRLSAA